MGRLLIFGFFFPLLFLSFFRLLHIFYFAGFRCDSAATLRGKTVVVTGGNAGVGRATALDLAKRGARVIIACRSEARAQPVVKEIRGETGNSDVFFMLLDLSSLRGVEIFVEDFLARESRLDVLVNNAGMAPLDEVSINEDGIEATMGVNHFGHFYLTNLLLERLKYSGPGSRVVTLSSEMYAWANRAAFHDFNDLKTGGLAGSIENPPSGYYDDNLLNSLPNFFLNSNTMFFQTPRMIRYSNSKLANILFTKELGRRLRGTGVTTYAVHPGVIATELHSSRGVADAGVGENRLLDGLGSPNIPDFFKPQTAFFKTPDEGAQTTVCCAVGEDYAMESGLFYADGVAVSSRMPERNDDELARRFWEWSEEVVAEILAKK